jgi:hypothetical protein
VRGGDISPEPRVTEIGGALVALNFVAPAHGCPEGLTRCRQEGRASHRVGKHKVPRLRSGRQRNLEEKGWVVRKLYIVRMRGGDRHALF